MVRTSFLLLCLVLIWPAQAEDEKAPLPKLYMTMKIGFNACVNLMSWGIRHLQVHPSATTDKFPVLQDSPVVLNMRDFEHSLTWQLAFRPPSPTTTVVIACLKEADELKIWTHLEPSDLDPFLIELIQP